MTRNRSRQSPESRLASKGGQLVELVEGTRVPQFLIESVLSKLHTMNGGCLRAAAHKARNPNYWVYMKDGYEVNDYLIGIGFLKIAVKTNEYEEEESQSVSDNLDMYADVAAIICAATNIKGSKVTITREVTKEGAQNSLVAFREERNCFVEWMESAKAEISQKEEWLSQRSKELEQLEKDLNDQAKRKEKLTDEQLESLLALQRKLREEIDKESNKMRLKLRRKRVWAVIVGRICKASKDI